MNEVIGVQRQEISSFKRPSEGKVQRTGMSQPGFGADASGLADNDPQAEPAILRQRVAVAQDENKYQSTEFLDHVEVLTCKFYILF
jgi:hypothetical protein